MKTLIKTAALALCLSATGAQADMVTATENFGSYQATQALGCGGLPKMNRTEFAAFTTIAELNPVSCAKGVRYVYDASDSGDLEVACVPTSLVIGLVVGGSNT